MISRIISAAIRGVLVACVVMLPALMLPAIDADAAQVSVLVAMLAAMFVFLEYVSSYPSFTEFRHAPPFNRMRFAMLFMIVLSLTLLARDAGALGHVVSEGATTLGRLLDIPYSPVRILVLGMPADSSIEHLTLARDAAALCYAMSICALLSFVLLVHLYDWPSRNGAFNVWVNLPLFDPTRGGDVLPRLRRDGYINIAAGVLLPYLMPFAFRMASGLVNGFSPLESQSFVWTMAAWAFIPASMIMRGIAMCRVAELIEEKRRRAYARAQHAG